MRTILFHYKFLTYIALALILFVGLLHITPVTAAANPTINYQGKLTDAMGQAVPNGTYNMRFYLYNATGGATASALWTETLTGSNQVTVTNGLFSVMLGSTTPLSSLNFNQTLYLGVEIGGTGSPDWDGEMSPRKILGTVPAAFEATRLSGIATSSFLRSDEADMISATTANTLLTIQQNGAGDIFNLYDGSTEVLTVTDGGLVGIGTATTTRLLNIGGTANAGVRITDTTNTVQTEIRSEDFQGFVGTFSNHDLRFVTNNTSRGVITNAGNWGIGTTTTTARLTVDGDLRLTGALRDATNDTGTTGQVLLSTGTSTNWVSTSTLGFGTSFVDILNDLSDVNATNVFGSLLYFNGTTWDDLATSSLNIALANTTGTLPVNRGGTGATTEVDARTNLGLVIGTNVQAYDTELAALAGLTSATDALPYFTGAGTAGVTTLTSFARGLLDDADATAMRSTLSLGSLATLSAISTTEITNDTITVDDINNSATIGANPALAANEVFFGTTGLIFEGSGADTNELLLTSANPGSDITVTIPATTGTLALTSSAMTGTFDGNNFAGGAIATGDLLYGSGAGTIAELAGVVTGNVLLSGGVSTAPAWGKVGLTTHVSGVLDETNGGTGLSSYVTGDLVYASGADTLAKQAIGTTGQVLTVSGGLPTWTSTSTLKIALGDTTGTLAVNRGGTGATDAPTARTNLGATTVGSNLYTLTNPSAITFLRVNADNTVSALDAAAFRTAIGAGSGGGSVTSVGLSVPTGFSVSGSPVTDSGTLALSYAAGYEGLLTASSTAYNTFYTTPSNRITAGTAIDWSGNTLNVNEEEIEDFVGTLLGGTETGLSVTYDDANNDIDFVVDTELAALAGLTSATDALPYFTGAGTAGVTTLTSFARGLLDDADATAMRSTLSLGSLATLSAISTTEITNDTITVDDINNSATIGANPALAANEVFFGTTGLIFEGATADTLEGLFTTADITGSDKTWTLPNTTGTLLTSGDSGTVNATIIADDTINFGDIAYNNTLAGNPALAVDECYFMTTTSGGGFICEGSTADTNEQLYLFPDVNGVDTTQTIALTDSAMTGTFDGNDFSGGAIATGDLLYGSGAGTIAERSIGTTGQVLTVSGGLPTWTSTSTLKIALGDTTGTLAVNRGGTGATDAPTARTNLGATTVGSNLYTLTNPSAITFLRVNADNTVSALDAAAFRTAIGAGSGGGSVTSVGLSVPTGFSVSGSPVTDSGTLALSYAAGYEGLLTASSTAYNTFYTTPSNRITAGTAIDWSGNTLNVNEEEIEDFVGTLLGGTETGLSVTYDDANNDIDFVVDTELAALAGLTSATDALPYFTGAGTAGVTTLTSFARGLLDDADATAMRSTLSLGSLATLSAISTTEITNDTITVDDINNSATIGANPALAANEVFFGTTGLIFEGATADTLEGLFTTADITGSDKTWTLPNTTGTLLTSGDSGTVNATIIADDTINFGDIAYNNTLAGNPALAVDECYFMTTTSGGGFICEGSTADTNEQLYLFPDVNGVDTTQTIALTDSAMTGTFDGNDFSGGAIATGDLLYGSGAGTIAERSIGTTGQVLQVVGGLPTWVATSSLGFAAAGSGITTFLGLTDTPSNFSINGAIPYESSDALAFSSNFLFDGTDLLLGTSNGLTFGSDVRLSRGVANRLDLASGDSFNIASGTLQLFGTNYLTGNNTSKSVTLGELAGATFTNSTVYNNVIGYQAGQYSSTTNYNNFVGYRAGQYNTSSDNNFLGEATGRYNTGAYNVLLGSFAGYNNAGSYNNSIGRNVGYSNTGSYNNFLGDFVGSNNTGNFNEFIGYQTGRYLQSTSTVAIGAEALYGSHATTFISLNNVALGYRAGYAANDGSGNNILIGYQAADNLTTGNNNIIIGYDVDSTSATADNILNIGNLIFGTGIDGTGTTLSTGNIGIGTTSPAARLAVQRTGVTGAGVIGLDQYLQTTNSTMSAVQFGNRMFLDASQTATTTLVGSILRVQDNSVLGNTVRGLEVQADRGTNTQGENTALSGFARTFGVRGTTRGDAGGTFEPAGGFFETQGTTQGNAIRGFSQTITTSALLSLYHSSSTFTGTGLEMNFGNTTGEFASASSLFIDLQNAGTPVFQVSAFGTTTIGDGTTQAGLQIPNGGICVDDDGLCTASTSGRITAREFQGGNSDLAEMYFSSQALAWGEIVSLKDGLSVTRATTETKRTVLGVVSTAPGLVMGADDTSLNADETAYPIALAGRVPIKLSNENGPIKAGDELTLSSLPGVAMKATSSGVVIGIALEDFDETRAYSDTYINQYADNIIVPEYVPVTSPRDPRIADGCFMGGGGEVGDTPCVPLTATTSDAQVREAEALAASEARERELRRLARQGSARVTLMVDRTVQVGQIVMFVDLGHRYLGETEQSMLASLMMSVGEATTLTFDTDTIWSRLVRLASGFVDGVLSLTGIKAERVETSTLCVDDVCVTADDLRALLQQSNTDEQVVEVVVPPVSGEATQSMPDTNTNEVVSGVTETNLDEVTTTGTTTNAMSDLSSNPNEGGEVSSSSASVVPVVEPVALALPGEESSDIITPPPPEIESISPEVAPPEPQPEVAESIESAPEAESPSTNNAVEPVIL